LGICPQRNSLFLNLTVKEHLQFFSGLRGFGVHDRAGMISLLEVLPRLRFPTSAWLGHMHEPGSGWGAVMTWQAFGLMEFEETLARHLSGGNKRKLCVAIAFLAPDVVILDEPTAGTGLRPPFPTW
jgi:ABC-type multidrug transport system ATPase subunit